MSSGVITMCKFIVRLNRTSRIVFKHIYVVFSPLQFLVSIRVVLDRLFKFILWNNSRNALL
jgi:hypothetical protein